MANSEMNRIRQEIHRVVVGQEEVIDLLLTCLLANGHSLLTGVPGLAKTLLARTLAATLGLKFQRIQFTPDLMPLDILGTEVLKTRGSEYELEWVEGPVFTHLLLADEINRATPRTQSALLQAMQEREVSVLGRHFVLEPPFAVMATRNPLDQEGTFPLPEAQLDRFLMNIEMTYPTFQDEVQMLELKGKNEAVSLKPVLSREEVLHWQRKVFEVAVSRHLLEKMVSVVSSTRPEVNGEIKSRIAWGAGPRATEALLHASRAYALLKGDSVLEWGHVEHIASPVLNHRIQMRLGMEDEQAQKESFLRDLVR